MTIDKELLLKKRLPEAEVDVPGVGTVRVRGLSRSEVMSMRSIADDIGAVDQRMIFLGMVEPRLTEAEVAEWYAGCPAAELEPVSEMIQRLSGMNETAEKEAYIRFEDQPDDEFRLPPS